MTRHQAKFKKYIRTKQIGNKGEAIVEATLSEHSIVHKIDGSKDLGLDLLCEWVNEEKPTQVMFGVQVKTTSKFLSELSRKTDNRLVAHKGFNEKIDDPTLRYWSGFDFPMFVFCVEYKTGRVYYKRYTSICHGLNGSTNEPYYYVGNQDNFFAVKDRSYGFCRDLYFDYLRCQHNKGLLTGVDPNDLGLKGWDKEKLYKGVYDQYLDKINETYDKYTKWRKYIAKK